MKNVFGKNYWRGLLAGLFLMGSLLSACDPEAPCLSAVSPFQIGFFAIDGEGAREASLFNFSEVRVIGSDSSLFLQSRADVSGLRLALNPTSDTTTFVFHYENGSDTLSVSYDRRFEVVSPDCGPSVSYSKLELVSHTFDSVNLLSTEITLPTKGFDLEIFSLSPCADPSTNRAEAGFFVFDEGGSSEARAFNFDQVRAVGLNGNLFTGKGKGIKSLNLALNPAADVTSFLFEYGEFVDTLSIAYKRYIYVGSPECGVDTVFRELSIVKNTFDSVKLMHTELKVNNSGFDIEIYNSANCESEATNKLESGFFILNDAGDPEPRAFNFDEVKAAESGEVFFTRNQDGVRSLELSLWPDTERTTFVFSNQQEIDTLVVGYKKNAKLFSPECSKDEFYTDLAIVKHTFDSVSLLTNKLFKNTEDLTIEIYP